MIRNAFVVTLTLGLALTGVVAVLYATNTAPVVPPVSAGEAATIAKPYVVKLHAQWCPFCMVTKDEWARLAETYAGQVNLVVLDFTTEAATETSRAAAERLHLSEFFDEYAGATGLVVVLDGRTREVLAEVGGNADFTEYQSAIDAALAVH